MLLIILAVIVVLLIGGFYYWQQQKLEVARAGANPEGLWVLDVEKTMAKINSMGLPREPGLTADGFLQYSSTMKFVITGDNILYPFKDDKSDGPGLPLAVSRKTDSVTELGIDRVPLAFVVSDNLMDGRAFELKYLVFKRGSDSERQLLLSQTIRTAK